MTHAIEDRRSQYQRDGVVHVRGLITRGEVAEIKSLFQDQLASGASLGFDDGLAPGDPLAKYPRVVQPHRRDDLAVGARTRALMVDSRIQGILHELVGPALGAQSMFYFKPPAARGQALHQDNLFLQAFPETCVAVWIAIDDADGENGGLAVVPGSHQLELICPDEADPATSFTSLAVSLPEGLAIVQTELAAGDALVFHGSLIHGSQPNTSPDRFRRSLIFHYVPDRSVEIAAFYQPLIAFDGAEVRTGESADGGPCGSGFAPVGP